MSEDLQFQKETSFPFGQPVIWTPNPEWIESSNLKTFMDRYGIGSLDDLQDRSVNDPEWFWDAVMKDLDIQFGVPYSEVLVQDDPAFPNWCVDGRMNIVYNCLEKWQSTSVADQSAFVWEGEEGTTLTYSYRELLEEVNRCANALLELGLGQGDAVGLYMPMTPELVAAFLAIIKIGGVILPLFSGYGPKAVSTRLIDASARAVVTADGFFRRGKCIDLKRVLDQALDDCPTVSKVLVVRRTGIEPADWVPDRDIWWHDLVPDQSIEAGYADTTAEDILMIIYTSGTTGRPKGAVHTHCGFPVKAAQDMVHAMDLKRGETMFWMTDMGWMMGPWLVFGTLLAGAEMVFFDGAPDYPDTDRVWKLVEDHAVTHLGISPVLIRALMVHGTEPVERHDVGSLRAVASTGSPWDPESWMWLFENVLESRKPILNYSGGTEISGGIVCGNFFRPLKTCAFSGPVPGMDADVVDESGNPVRRSVGELVIRGPWIGMTRGFWNDHARYLESYWRKIPGVWMHGDFAAIDKDGLWYILGRSDDTIKVAGKRLGPAEAEALVNAHPDVVESAAIGIPHEIKGEELAIYCVLQDGVDPTDQLRNSLTDLVMRELGKPLKPRFIAFTKALPKTRNAKVIRRLIKSVYLGNPPGDTSSLENPDTLDAIRNAET